MARPSSCSVLSVLAGVAIGSTATLVLLRTIHQRKKQTDKERSVDSAVPSKKHSIPLHIRQEQLSRHELFFGTDGLQKISNARICVVGCGGVGSHTVHMLARAGVKYIRLIDFDQVTLSSLNRHACATLEDVGTPKVMCLTNYLQKLCPDQQYLQLEPIVEMYTAENGEELLSIAQENQHWDIVIDCIDDVPTKAALIAHCIQHKIRVLSCMGAGGKADFTRLHVSDLRSAAKDPLASKLRQYLRKMIADTDNDDSYLDRMQDLAIVFSSEKTIAKLADFTPEQQQGQDSFGEYGAVDGMRIRVLPVLGTMPAIMGQALASMALTELGGIPVQPVTSERVGRNVRHKAYQHLKRREEKIRAQVLQKHGLDKKKSTNHDNDHNDDAALEGRVVNGYWIGPVMIDRDDVEYLLEIWRNRCAVTGARLGTVLELCRWDLSKPSTCDNLVLMSVHALEEFDAPDGKDKIPAAIRAAIEERLATCKTGL